MTLDQHLLIPDEDYPLVDGDTASQDAIAEAVREIDPAAWCDAGQHEVDPRTLNWYSHMGGTLTCCETCRIRSAERLAAMGI